MNECKEVHGDEYDYSKAQYINNHTKVIITCAIHGDFEQRPLDHLKGRGCALCYGTEKMTNEEFIERAKKVHKNRYNYDDVCYVKCKTHVIIKCPDHGEFMQRPTNHLKGRGCPHCCLKQNSWYLNFL